MKLLPFISLFFIALLAAPSLASSTTYITPTRENVTGIMLDYNLDNQNNSYQLACEIGQYVSEEYGWNCDIRELKFATHSPIYINVFYPAADNKNGYKAYYGWFGPQKKEVTLFWGKDKNMYYKDWNSNSTKECKISGVKNYNIVKSYFGGRTSEPVLNITDPVGPPEENNSTTQPVENTTAPVNDKPVVILDNSTIINASGDLSDSMNSVENSTGVINNQGNGNWIQQFKFELSDIKNSTVNFFMNFGGQ